jgi:hypothetical protein
MLAQVIFAFDLARWETWVIPVVGLTSAGLALAIGRLMLRRSTELGPPPAKVDGSANQADPFVHGSATEHRRALRRRGKTVRVLVSNADAKEEPWEGWVIDRSVGGLCISLNRAIDSETVLSVRAADAPDTIPWVQITVRSCRQEKKYWELGCQFVRTPPWNVMLLFG